VVSKNICWVEPMHQTSQTEVDSTMPATDDIMRRQFEANVLLIKALGGGWDVSTLPKV
jgi:hypothetical protein